MKRFLIGLMVLSACAPGESPVMEAEMMVEEVADVAGTASRQSARAGVLTAGDIDDVLNLGDYRRYAGKASEALDLPKAGVLEAIVLRLRNPDSAPAPGVRVTLRRQEASEPLFSGYSGVDGALLVHPAIYGQSGKGDYEMRAFDGDGQRVVREKVRTGTRSNIALPFRGAWEPDFLDLAFVVDTTGSMGDELDWLTRDLMRIVDRAKRAAPGVDIRFGLIVYRDEGDEYVVRNYGFTNSARKMRGWLRRQEASGGGDYPEAADLAMQVASEMNWRRGRGERLVFHLADAPPHVQNATRYLSATRALAQEGVQIFGLGASGVAAESEFLMRQAAVLSNGRYLFLTDDSGVGHSHEEPTISCYRVTALSGLMERVLASELSGRRVEASGDEVIREVGTYRAGVCKN